MAAGDVPQLPPDTDLPAGDGAPGVYTIDRFLGSGGMSSVYLVMVNDPDKMHNAYVIKVPSRLKWVPRIFREAWWAQRQVEGIVRVEWVDQTVYDGVRFPMLVMPFMPAGNLFQKIIHPHGGRTALLSVKWMRQIAATLQRFPGVHRDLKPENILFSTPSTPMIADFGLAIPDNAEDIRAWGDVITGSGTQMYMAPEQWRALRPDRRADIYALGVILYELMHGGLPYALDDDLKRKVQTGDIVWAKTGYVEVDRFIATATQTDAVNRYQNYDEVLVALDAAMAEIEAQRRKR